jgi:hypothetical protein
MAVRADWQPSSGAASIIKPGRTALVVRLIWCSKKAVLFLSVETVSFKAEAP